MYLEIILRFIEVAGRIQRTLVTQLLRARGALLLSLDSSGPSSLCGIKLSLRRHLSSLYVPPKQGLLPVQPANNHPCQEIHAINSTIQSLDPKGPQPSQQSPSVSGQISLLDHALHRAFSFISFRLESFITLMVFEYHEKYIL